MNKAMSKPITMYEVLRDHIFEKSKDLKESQNPKSAISSLEVKSVLGVLGLFKDRKSPKEMVFYWCFRP